MSRWNPEPPVAMPPARTVQVPGRGEVFLRDSGGDGAPLLLLHGWTATADLNWYAQYGPLSAAYRVIAVDHRGEVSAKPRPVTSEARQVPGDAGARGIPADRLRG